MHSMGRKRTIRYRERDLEVESVDFTTREEHWNEYALGDGATVRVRVLPVEMLVATRERNEAGDPLVVVSNQVLVQYLRPEEGTEDER
tara:strand:- start:2242 stop:2505 length:264 start_codon:yes stop_codon:yes gene_type:complete